MTVDILPRTPVLAPAADLADGEPRLAEPNEMLRLYQAVRRVLATDDGQRMLTHLKTQVRHGQSVLYPGQADRTAFQLGQQDIVNWLVNIGGLTADQMAVLAERPAAQPAANGVDPMWAVRPVAPDDFLFPVPRKE